MNRDDLIAMARECGVDTELDTLTCYGGFVEVFEQFAALVAAAEREAIAQMIEDAPELVPGGRNDQGGCVFCGFDPKFAASYIRARSEG